MRNKAKRGLQVVWLVTQLASKLSTAYLPPAAAVGLLNVRGLLLFVPTFLDLLLPGSAVRAEPSQFHPIILLRWRLVRGLHTRYRVNQAAE